tara:strand:- start:2515 stop:2820 length:306 start_codon:yes stop_codon:yes gene_type:complete
MISNYYETAYPIFQAFWNTGGIYLAWTAAHWAAIQTYQYLCVPNTFYGLLFGAAFTTQLPQCKAIFWLITQSESAITNMWILLGAWFITQSSNVVFWKKNV